MKVIAENSGSPPSAPPTKGGSACGARGWRSPDMVLASMLIKVVAALCCRRALLPCHHFSQVIGSECALDASVRI